MTSRPLINGLKQLWVWRRHHNWGWVEAAVLTMGGLYLCTVINPANPLYLHSIFPWPWIAALIIVFQYGLGPSLLSIAIITAFAVTKRDSGALSMADFQAYVLSGMTLIFISALYGSKWIKAINKAETMYAYTDERLKSLSRSYYMLRISLDYLEQNLITKPFTLRLCLQDIQNIAIKHDGTLSQETAYAFLQIITQFCSLQSTGIYVYDNKFLQTNPFVELGTIGELLLDDPLIKRCLDTNEVSYTSINQIEDTLHCNYLMAFPLFNTEQEKIGLLVIKEMPFWSLTEDTIRVLSILIFYFTHDIILSEKVKGFMRIYPDASIDFAQQLSKLILLKHEMHISSALVAVIVDKSLRPHDVIEQLKKQHRLLDSFWSVSLNHTDVLISLLPFTGAAGVQGYLNRISLFIKSDLGLAVDQQQIKTRSIELYGTDPFEVMKGFLQFIEGERDQLS